MGKHGFQERQKLAFCLSYSNRDLNVAFLFYVLESYLSKGSKSLLKSGIFYAQTGIVETCIYDV